MKGGKGRNIKVILGGKGEGGRGDLGFGEDDPVWSAPPGTWACRTMADGVTYIHGTSTEDLEIQ
jgi:hypothetical protein